MEREVERWKLEPSEIELFRHNGFIKLPTRIPKKRVEELKAAALVDIQGEVEPVARQDGRVDRISNLWGRGGVFRKTIESDEILEPLESLLGPNIEFMLNRHNHVYLRGLNSLASTELHRDCKEWSRTILSVLLYLEDSHLENGCTHVVPGSHHLPTFKALDRDGHLFKTALSHTIPLPMPAGGLLAIDGLLLHRAAVNQSNNTRMSMTLGYHSADEFSVSDDRKHVLVRGERFYGGNDERSMDRHSRPRE